MGFLSPLGGGFLGVVLGGTGGVKIGTVFLKKTRVGFGRTELSLRLSCTEFSALSSGHGPRGLCFYGGSSGADFCIFWVFRKVAAKFLKISRKATEIIEQSTENQLKPKRTNGF